MLLGSGTRPDHREPTGKFLLRLLTSTSHAFNAACPSPERKTDLNPVPGILKDSFSGSERRRLSCLWSIIASWINFLFVSDSHLCLYSFLHAVKDTLFVGEGLESLQKDLPHPASLLLLFCLCCGGWGLGVDWEGAWKNVLEGLKCSVFWWWCRLQECIHWSELNRVSYTFKICVLYYALAIPQYKTQQNWKQRGSYVLGGVDFLILDQRQSNRILKVSCTVKPPNWGGGRNSPGDSVCEIIENTYICFCSQFLVCRF